MWQPNTLRLLHIYNYTTHQNMQGIQSRHEDHVGSTPKGDQILGQQTSSKARASTILWRVPTDEYHG
jgi:hypothetical protein